MTLLNGILAALLAATTLGVIIGWHVTGRGRWRTYVSGRAIMALLSMIGAMATLTALSLLIGPLPGRAIAYGVLHALLLVAVVQVGAAIITITRRDRGKED